MSRLIDADALPVYRVKILHAFGIIEGNVIFPEDVKNAPPSTQNPSSQVTPRMGITLSTNCTITGRCCSL